MNLAEYLLWSAPALGLAIGLVLYVRHGHRRLYRELRQLREATGPAARQQAVEDARAQVQPVAARVEALGAQLGGLVEAVAGLKTLSQEVQEAQVSHSRALEAVRQGVAGSLGELSDRQALTQAQLEASAGSSLELAERLDTQQQALVRFEPLLGDMQSALAELGSRLDTLEASGERRDAQLALRHQEFELAFRGGLASLEERLEHALKSLREAVGSLEQGTHVRLEALSNLQESLRSAQEAASGAVAQASQTSAGLLAELVARPTVLDDRAIRPLHRLQIDLEFIKNRMSSYLGEGMGLTHLVDETPIYLNTADIGCPANFINGGRYEEEYLQVLASFCRPETVFLDIGANLGVFSLRLAPYLRQGRILAFEPNARIRDLFERSVHLNGLRERIEIFECGASDEAAELVLEVPQGHAGGGHVEHAQPGDTRARIQVRPLDDVLRDLPGFQVAKIDVEGHELHALRGMQALLARSPQAVVLFEKLIAHAGLEAPIMELFASHGMQVWRIEGVRLEPVDLAGFEQGTAYFLAARAETVGDERDRGFIRIRPGHLFTPLTREEHGRLVPVAGPHGQGSLLFHGPYWYLPRGVYRVQVEGSLGAPLQIQVTEKFGYGVAQAVLGEGSSTFDFVAERDLTHFELVGRTTGADPAFEIESLRVSRIG